MKAYFTFFFFVVTISTYAQTLPDSLQRDSVTLEEVVITASKVQESLLRSPVSIEKLSIRDIKQSAQPSFFDAIENVKGIQMITPSLGFKVINARGFTNTTNVRFVQMVDGADNQAPHIGAPIANSLGPNDLDIKSVELIPGSASAIYGMNAINGIANFITKDPFLYQGLSVQHKTAVNHVDDPNSNSSLFTETSLRYAKSYKGKFGIKLNGSYMQGKDWIADNRMDLNPKANSSTNLIGENNPGKDAVNIYGDESSDRRTITLGGKQYVVSRTGYAEKDVASYGLQNWKGDANLYYRPLKNIELGYTYRFAFLNTLYQRTNRFRFDDYLTQQHVLFLKSKSIQFKTYLTSENTGKSYNIRSMGENVDRSFKKDDQWYKDFTTGYNQAIGKGESIPQAMTDARNIADLGRPQPGSKEITNQISNLRNINNWDIGAALRVKAYLYHAEVQHNLSESILKSIHDKYKMDFSYGFDFREYIIVPDGNYFINPVASDRNLQYWKVGGFAQATKYLFKEKLKINTVLRVDKNQYFSPKLNPRVAIVYSPFQNHNIRLSFQNGYRFPSIFEAFSNINSGGVKRVGGLPVMSNGIFENSYLRNSIDAFQAAVTNDVNKNGLSQTQAIEKNKVLLKKNSYTYIQPERVSGFELGYRATLIKEKLYADIDFYSNTYKNLIAQVEANIPKTNDADSIAYYLNNKSKQDRYRLWTNSKTVSYNYGGTVGLTYRLPYNFKISGNCTYAKLHRKDQQDGLEDGFNTPEWIYNFSFGNDGLIKNFAFNINFRRQTSFLWQSALATGTVSAYSTLDAQIQYSLLKNKLNIKLGGTNILNKYYYSFIGGPAVGAFYYTTLTYAVF